MQSFSIRLAEDLYAKLVTDSKIRQVPVSDSGWAAASCAEKSIELARTFARALEKDQTYE